MSDLQGRTPDNKGRHYDFINSRIPHTFKKASVQRIQELSAARKGPTQWVVTASNFNHNLLQDANLKLWAAQNNVDQMLDELQDIYTFAEPLLSAALKEHYGVDDNVRTTYLRLYLPKERPWYAINISQGVVTRTVSLLDAALHNFARSETGEAESDFVSQPDERGLFDIKPIKRKMSIAQFQTLCRELDIGARYAEYLESFLLPDDAVAKTWLKYNVVESQKAAFKAATHLAQMTGNITQDTRDLVLAMLDGQRNLRYKGKLVQFGEMSLLDTPLTGIVLITPNLDRTNTAAQVIAYIPQDPEHPLKEYPTVDAFMNELTRQLRDNDFIESAQMTYRQYFSQFVAQPQRGHFFAELQQRLFEVTQHEKEALDQRPVWREEPVVNPKVRFDFSLITGDFWTHLYQQKLNKILNDAKHIAVSTADTDSNARWAWWDNFKKIVSDIFNVALMIVTPFVPGLGEMMMVYTAYQITNDVITSIVDLAEGQWAEAAEHVVGVVTDIIQLAAFAAGAEIGKLARLKLSPLIEGMKPVQLPDGQQRLWHPDLKPYEQPKLQLPVDSLPDEHGLHRHEGQEILPLENRHYAVQQDPITGNYHIKHPRRSDAYRPELKHNGSGAWTHEAENPRDWEGPTLMRRLGHSVADVSDVDLEQVRTVSGTEDNALRKMHMDNASPPPLLTDSLNRFKIQKEVAQAGERIRTGQPLAPSSYWFVNLPTSLEGWPADKALKVYADPSQTGSFRQYGNPDASTDQTLSTDLSHVMSGKLPESLVVFLDEEELKHLFGRQVPKGEQLQALRNLLADEAETQKMDIFNYQYQASERSDNPQLQQLVQSAPTLPRSAAQKLLANASRADLERMNQEQRVPLDLKLQAREAAFEARANHAYEGLYDDALLTPDTENLVLNALRVHSDTFNDLRIEVRDGTFDGPLRCSVGSDEATTVRLLIRNEHAKYEVRDGTDHHMHEGDDFYDSVLYALPTQKRIQLGYRTGQGRQFKQWVMAKTEAPAERRTALLEPPIRPVADPQTVSLLRGPVISKTPATLEDSVRDLYPHLSEREINTFVRSLGGSHDEALQKIRKLDRDLYTLKETLNKWRYQQPEGWGPGANSYLDNGGEHIAKRLIECFERKPTVFGERAASVEAGYALDLSTEFNRYDLERWWKKLPDIKYYLDQVTTLNLDRTSFSADADGLLKDFPHISQLSARDCQLTQLPGGIGRMHALQTLRLMNNRIKLTPEAVEQLRNLTHMETLRLDDNPQLGMLPNVERMPKLKILSLSTTGATTWPEGLFKKRRPRGFFLDLMENPLEHIPKVTPGSDDARIIARTRIDERGLSDSVRIAYEGYRRSVGLSTTQPYSAAAERAMDQWPMSDDTEWWSSANGLGTFRDEAWHDLMAEPGSEGFFRLIQKQTLSADYLAGGEARKQLSARVWRMIEAIDLDSELRKELFEMARAPTTCADAGAQVFNNMGIKVLASEAHAFSTSGEDLEIRLVTLAKGAARLTRVDDIARADFGGRPGTPDEVEVYLAYETGLTQRLGLPWQSETMLFRRIAGVSPATLDLAYDTVVSMEAGDGLVNDMLEQSFWENYLRDTYPTEFRRNARQYEHKTQLLDELRDARLAWADSKGSPLVQRRALKQRLQYLGRQLGVPESIALADEPITDAVYDSLLNDIGYEEKQLSRRLTREALQKAGQ
ncbi:RING-type E3 ubiquitin transferase [Pseudomonas sp. IT-P253]|uniref:NEL-type E3 ubiquitin ligase domain-containing protein n=1 Tax=Pseudomonas sp. IT-P253 TaxID=3026455 RepID=UPI0039E021E9